jgi:integrase
MGRPRGKDYIPLSVDIDGITIPAFLRPPRGKRARYAVVWKLGGRWREVTTRQSIEHEARRVGAEIVRGKPAPSASGGVLTVDAFVRIQEKHFAKKAYKHKGRKSLDKFITVWKDFLAFHEECRRSRLASIQQVTVESAVKYVEWLESKKAAPGGIHSKRDTLRSAWNRVRRGHPKSRRDLHPDEMVTCNPWEEVEPHMPEKPTPSPIQLQLAEGEFQKLYQAFHDRPVAQLFLIVSLWSAGRLEEMSLAEWSWVAEGGYIDIPDSVAKRGKGRVVRIPPRIMKELESRRLPESPFIFAGFTEELRKLSKRHATRILPYNPGTYDLICKHIARLAKKAGLEGVTHHVLRKTASELSDEGEELSASERSSRNLGMTTKNKEGHYVIRRFHGLRFYLRADNLYRGLSQALSRFPEVAELVGVERIKSEQDSLRESTEKMSDTEWEAFVLEEARRRQQSTRRGRSA